MTAADLASGLVADLELRALGAERAPGRVVRAQDRETLYLCASARGLTDTGVGLALRGLDWVDVRPWVISGEEELGSPDPSGDDDQLLLALERGPLAEAAATLDWAAACQTVIAAVESPPVFDPPALMGVVNVTPDSFSDGGRFLAPAAAVEHGLELLEQGADWLDVGGESSRPGAEPVPAEEELERVLPVIERLAAARPDARISIDTVKAEVAEAALDAGALMVNDISAGVADPAMLPLVADRNAWFVAMHRQGDPAEMQRDPRYGDPVREVCEALRERLRAALMAGIDARKILLDPGIGFGKRLGHNLELLRRLGELRSLGRPLLLGVSRKSFIGHLKGSEEQEDWRARRRRDRPDERVGGTAAAVAACVQGGAEMLRVHDVAVMGEAALVARALARPHRHAP